MEVLKVITASVVCRKCGDTGWVALPVMPGEKDPRVKRCECKLGSRHVRLLKQASIPKRYEPCTLEGFQTDFQDAHRSLASARLFAGKFVEEYPLINTGLLFAGPPGVGKTHLAVAIIKSLILLKGVPSLFVEYRELLKEIQNSYNPTVAVTELEILRPVFTAEVLVLDELGAQRPTEWVFDAVAYILNRRYSDRKTTIFTTNRALQPPTLAIPNPKNLLEPSSKEAAQEAMREIPLGERIGSSMWSRLLEMCKFIQIEGTDYRTRLMPDLRQ